MALDLYSRNLSLIWEQTLGSVVSYLPTLLFAILTAVLGIILGNATRSLILRLLHLVNFERFVKDSRLQLFLKKAEVTHKLEDILAGTVKWLIVLTFFISATNTAGLTSVASVLTEILQFVPRVISAMIVLSLGVLLAGVVEGIVKSSLASIDLKTARLFGKVSSYLLLTIATLAAFSELGIAESFVNILFIGVIATLSLAIGLALGLGAKDTAAKLISDYVKGLQKELGK